MMHLMQQNMQSRFISNRAQSNINSLEFETQRDETEQFYDDLLDAFETINFYNLLQSEEEKVGKNK